MNKILISKMVPAEQLPKQFKEDLAVTPETMLRVTVEVASGEKCPGATRKSFWPPSTRSLITSPPCRFWTTAQRTRFSAMTKMVCRHDC